MHFELPVHNNLSFPEIDAHGDAQIMLPALDIGKHQEPDHLGMHSGKLTHSEVGKDSEQGVLAGGRVDVDAVAHEPAEKLWF